MNEICTDMISVIYKYEKVPCYYSQDDVLTTQSWFFQKDLGCMCSVSDLAFAMTICPHHSENKIHLWFCSTLTLFAKGKMLNWVAYNMNMVSNCTCQNQKYTAYVQSTGLPEMINCVSCIAITDQAPGRNINVNIKGKHDWMHYQPTVIGFFQATVLSCLYVCVCGVVQMSDRVCICSFVSTFGPQSLCACTSRKVLLAIILRWRRSTVDVFLGPEVFPHRWERLKMRWSEESEKSNICILTFSSNFNDVDGWHGGMKLRKTREIKISVARFRVALNGFLDHRRPTCCCYDRYSRHCWGVEEARERIWSTRAMRDWS